ncbi:MAG TPA: PaaI family thioesterase [Thermoleophilaceae bacterium]
MTGLTPEHFNQAGQGRLPGLFGLEILRVELGEVDARLDLRSDFLAPNGFLHAGTVVSLADTCCGYGCMAALPEGMVGFTTSELKSNFIRSTREDDALSCEARMAHGGRTTQVWDATVRRESDGKVLALFRCTQYLLVGADPRTQQA